MINEKYVNRYCCEDINLIENYNKAISDTTQTWDCHHRKETDEGLSVKQLKEQNLYFNRPAIELIFLTHDKHQKIHWLNDSYRNNLSESHKEQITWMKGKHHTEESKQKNRESHLGRHHSEETRKKQSESNKGKFEGIKNPMYGKPSPIRGKHCVYDENGKRHYVF